MTNLLKRHAVSLGLLFILVHSLNACQLLNRTAQHSNTAKQPNEQHASLLDYYLWLHSLNQQQLAVEAKRLETAVANPALVTRQQLMLQSLANTAFFAPQQVLSGLQQLPLSEFKSEQALFTLIKQHLNQYSQWQTQLLSAEQKHSKQLQRQQQLSNEVIELQKQIIELQGQIEQLKQIESSINRNGQ